jgi:hypothetical protein
MAVGSSDVFVMFCRGEKKPPGRPGGFGEFVALLVAT